MHERDETMLFSAVAILLAALTLGGLTGRVFPDARAAANEREIKVARYTSCSSTAQMPSSRAGRNG